MVDLCISVQDVIYFLDPERGGGGGAVSSYVQFVKDQCQ